MTSQTQILKHDSGKQRVGPSTPAILNFYLPESLSQVDHLDLKVDIAYENKAKDSYYEVNGTTVDSSAGPDDIAEHVTSGWNKVSVSVTRKAWAVLSVNGAFSTESEHESA